MIPISFFLQGPQKENLAGYYCNAHCNKPGRPKPVDALSYGQETILLIKKSFKMKPKKLNFSEIKNALSRDEMKKIMAGSGSSICTVDCTGCSAYKCTSGCSESKDNDYVICSGVRHNCRAYPSCWS